MSPPNCRLTFLIKGRLSVNRWMEELPYSYQQGWKCSRLWAFWQPKWHTWTTSMGFLSWADLSSNWFVILCINLYIYGIFVDRLTFAFTKSCFSIRRPFFLFQIVNTCILGFWQVFNSLLTQTTLRFLFGYGIICTNSKICD